ncbi:MAG TPA: class I SAM-dependent RNA methyltransferase [Syntrophorhabdaceae bacterium]|nr:class I SAM-dependent RNA methyltransferase [Syntrophorhabdaceae bacterium]
MATYSLTAITSFGMESILARELKEKGIKDLVVENGKVSFNGDEHDIVRCNIWLRTADRILMNLKSFQAKDFEELFQNTLSIEWPDILPMDSIIHVVGKSVRSKLFSIRHCQSIVKKAIVEAMKRRHKIETFPETGPLYKIEISLYKDHATISMDTTGMGLHKRGYRTESTPAPLRETVAAGIILLSRWDPAYMLADLFCGSGTIPIEAALLARNIAPGINRHFVSEDWWQTPKALWDKERKEAKGAIKKIPHKILASDIDENALRKAKHNAIKAGVYECISFEKKDFNDFKPESSYGYVISNPPYGERIGDKDTVERIYTGLGRLYKRLKNWSFFILSPHPEFQRLFNKKAEKNRKIYNGKIKCYFYQYGLNR